MKVEHSDAIRLNTFQHWQNSKLITRFYWGVSYCLICSFFAMDEKTFIARIRYVRGFESTAFPLYCNCKEEFHSDIFLVRTLHSGTEFHEEQSEKTSILISSCRWSSCLPYSHNINFFLSPRAAILKSTQNNTLPWITFNTLLGTAVTAEMDNTCNSGRK